MRMGSQNLKDYLEAVASKSSTPGGGAVAAVAAAESFALIAMVMNFTKKPDARLNGILERSAVSREKLIALADADSAAFDQVMKAYRGDGDLQTALKNAAAVPLDVIDICLSHIEDIELLAEFGNTNLITDTAIAASLLYSSLDASEVNVLVNAKSMDNHGEHLQPGLSTLPEQRERLATIVSAIKSQLT